MSKTNLFTLHSLEQKGKSFLLAEGSWCLPCRTHLTFISSHGRGNTNTAISETKNTEQMRSLETPGEEQAAGLECVQAKRCRMASHGQEFRTSALAPFLLQNKDLGGTWKICFNPYFQSFIKKKKRAYKALHSLYRYWEFYLEPYVKKISSVNICKQLYLDTDFLISICTILERQRIEDPASS